MRRGRFAVAVTVGLLMVAPAVAAVLSLAGRRWYPTNDFAIIDLRVRDVFTADTPLTGLYSRPGWNHPGPLMFWGLAPLSWLSGHAPWATRIVGAVLQGIALVWLAVVTARTSLRLLLAAGVVTSLTYLASNQWLLREPWNLHVPIPYFVLFLFLAYLVSVGRSRQLIGMSIVASVLVQTHVSYTLLVLAGSVYALGWTAYDGWRARRPPVSWRSTLAISAGIWLVLWSAPLVDVVTDWPGNLGRIAAYFADGNHPSVGVSRALGLMAEEFRFVPPWIGGGHRVQAISGFGLASATAWLLVSVALLAAACVAVRISHRGEDGRLVGLAALMLVTGVVAIAGADQARAYTFQWRAIVAAFLVVACAWAIAGAVIGRTGAVWRAVATTVAVVAVAWGSIAMTVAVVRRPSAFIAAREPDLERVMSKIDAGPRLPRTVRLRWVGLPSMFDGLVNELDRRGVEPRVDSSLGRVFGEGRTLARSAPAETWYVTEGGSAVPGLLARRGARLMVSTTPLTPRRERELAALQKRVAAALVRAGRHPRRATLDSSLVAVQLRGIPGVASRDLQRLAELNAAVERSFRCRCAIVAVPPRATRSR